MKQQIADVLADDQWSTDEELADMITSDMQLPVSYENLLVIIQEERPFFLHAGGGHIIDWTRFERCAMI
ncbi:hypothetical protein [Chitinophaga sp. Cy-1792]|uniref:hypothetical protein n=1 Tax=Chitinophaga sp. Cy-1792 TaxID=2608339 RepID=UPI00142415C4|nr:hypothetical protein [Chitinophaga sp. Cy-1792]NIG54730.1 hypothetical protein [Chitinophaga sp. Cy-1792]